MVPNTHRPSVKVSSKENAWEACVLLDSWAVLVQLDGGMSTIVNHMVSSCDSTGTAFNGPPI